MTPIFQIILFGCIGGSLPDILRLFKNPDQRANVLKSLPSFLFGFILQIVLGGLAAFLALSLNLIPGAGEVITGTLVSAAAYGFGAPEIITRLLSSVPTGGNPGTNLSQDFNLRNWWAL